MPITVSQKEEQPSVAEALRQLREVRNRLAKDFVDKDDIIDMMLVCAVGQEPMVIFGEPGTAKSALISRFCELVKFEKQDYFRYLLTSFTEPDELLGVVDIKAYLGESGKEPTFKRFGEGGIQKAKIVFLDEIFRANSAILNTLLSIINERIYYESGEAKPAETRVVYGASNDAPTEPNLRAFYSRFPIRVLSNRVSETHPRPLLEKGWEREYEELDWRSRPLEKRERDTRRVESICQPIHLQVCQDCLRTHWAPRNVKTWADQSSVVQTVKRAYLDVVRLLNGAPEQFQIDDRKTVKLFKLVLARAMLRENGGPDALPTLTDVYDVLRHAWETPELSGLADQSALDQIKQVDHKYMQDRTEDGMPIPSLGKSGLDPALRERQVL
jgi:MoxR-like ATPase